MFIKLWVVTLVLAAKLFWVDKKYDLYGNITKRNKLEGKFIALQSDYTPRYQFSTNIAPTLHFD